MEAADRETFILSFMEVLRTPMYVEGAAPKQPRPPFNASLQEIRNPHGEGATPNRSLLIYCFCSLSADHVADRVFLFSLGGTIPILCTSRTLSNGTERSIAPSWLKAPYVLRDASTIY